MADLKEDRKFSARLNRKPMPKTSPARASVKEPIVIENAERHVRAQRERGRHQQPTVVKKSSPYFSKTATTYVERERLTSPPSSSNKGSTTHGNVAKNRPKPEQMTKKRKLTLPERGRHGVSRKKVAPNSNAVLKKSKMTVGTNESRKTTSLPADHRSPSNKHVVNKSIPPDQDILDTDVDIEYVIDQEENKLHPPEKENTNLAELPPLPAFLTRKSSSLPNIGRAFCDKIAFTFDTTNKNEEDLIRKAHHMSKAYGEHYILAPLPQRNDSFYRNSYRLQDQDGNHAALIQFGPKHSKMKFYRIELNPAAIGEKGIDEVLRVAKGLFGPTFRNDVLEGNFTRLDATVDIKKIRPDDLLIYSDRARSSGLWARYFSGDKEEWTTETQTLGSPTSDYFVTMYDKTAQLWKIKGTTSNELVTRIEARFTPRDKNSASMRVKDIMLFKNPFAPINVAYYPAPEDGDFHFKFFICAARWYGAEQALKMIKNRNTRSCYWNFMHDYEPDWWQPEKLWGQFLNDLRATGLFPDEIFRKLTKV